MTSESPGSFHCSRCCVSAGRGSGRCSWWHCCHCDGWERWELLSRAAQCFRCDEEPGGSLQWSTLCGTQWTRLVRFQSVRSFFSPIICKLAHLGNFICHLWAGKGAALLWKQDRKQQTKKYSQLWAVNRRQLGKAMLSPVCNYQVWST